MAVDGKSRRRSGRIRGVLEVVSVPVTLGLERPEILGMLSSATCSTTRAPRSSRR